MRTPITPLLTVGLAALASVGCGDEHTHDEHGEDPAAEACEHAVDGPFRPVQAAEADAAPAIQSYAHSRVDITLTTEGDGNGGSVAFNVAEAGDYTFFLTADVPLSFAGADGPIAVEETVAVDDCAEVAVGHTVELPTGAVILTFGPTDATTVGLVFEAAEGHHDHE